MHTSDNAKDINDLWYRQYTSPEFREAALRVLENPALPLFLREFFPDMDAAGFRRIAEPVRDSQELQKGIVSRIIDVVLRNQSRGLTVSGFENIPRDRKVVFISNHRDIVCDPALLAYALIQRGLDGPQICLGDNLLISPLVVDLLKLNKAVIVRRNLPARELYLASMLLSEHIRSQVTSGTDSIWIAQREGRAKDGLDRTQSGVIKMLAMSGPDELIENLTELHLIPVSISYEFDPCDLMKALELHCRAMEGSYRKTPGEDARSMLKGILGNKGHIHIHFGEDLSPFLGGLPPLVSKREQIAAVTEKLDQEIARGYRCWPTHFIALELLEDSAEVRGRFTQAEKANFIARLERRLDSANLTAEIRRDVARHLLAAYANPARQAIHDPTPGHSAEGSASRRMSSSPGLHDR